LCKNCELIENKAFEWNIELNKGKESNLVGMQEYTINAQYTIYVNCPKKTLEGDFTQAKGTVQIDYTQVRWFSRESVVRLDLVRGGQRHSNLSPSDLS
jgi:hypothetical protein